MFLPLNSNLQPSPSEAPSTEGSQTSGTPLISGTVPTIIRKSLPVPFSKEDLRGFRRHFSILSFVQMRLLGEGDQVFEPRIDPSCSEGPHAPRWTPIKWSYLLGEMDERVTRIWTPLSTTNHPKFPKSAQVTAQISLLQEIFQDPYDYKVFCEEGVLIHAGMIRSKRFDSFVELPITWEEVLTASRSSVEPKMVPFSTMKGKRVPLFKRAGKRPSDPNVLLKLVLAKRIKTLAYMPTKKEVLDLTQDLLPSAPLGNTSVPPDDADTFEVPLADTPLVIGDSSKWKECDLAPKVTTEEIGKPYEEYSGPLELQGVIAKHLVRAMNASHVLARRVDRLDVDLGLTRQSERASQFKVQELEKNNGELLRNQEITYNKKKIANDQALQSAHHAVEEFRSQRLSRGTGGGNAYCLCCFVKTFKEVNPSLAAHYQEFIYPPCWFSSLDINAPLSPVEGEEAEAAPEAQDQLQPQDPPQA
ncbi:hypothetical protein LIER_29461 [Lithospermum erythrorhizon]|uniref:Uncharacterized protein n=1 Tax=Lithospermum erythrorhizon TaxID=34254 RepID=A0AAV3RJA0_LITER